MRQQEEAEKFDSLFFLLPPSSKLVAWWRAVLCTELVYVLTILIIDIYTNNCMNVFLPNIVVLDLGSSSLGSFSVLVTNLPNTQLIPLLRSNTSLPLTTFILRRLSTCLTSSLEDHMITPTSEGTKPSS